MFGFSGKCSTRFKTDGPKMLAGATPSLSFIRSHSRKYNHAGKARKFGSAISGAASLAESCAADLLPSVRTREPRSSLQRPRPFSEIRDSALQVRLLTHAIAATEFTGLALGRTL